MKMQYMQESPVDILVVFLENAMPRYKDKVTYLHIKPRQNRSRFAFAL
jgi:hypothetical protein